MRSIIDNARGATGPGSVARSGSPVPCLSATLSLTGDARTTAVAAQLLEKLRLEACVSATASTRDRSNRRFAMYSSTSRPDHGNRRCDPARRVRDQTRLRRRDDDRGGDNPDRITSEFAFAKLVDVCPITASSGVTNRHRLYRGGHRQANAAIDRTVIVRMRSSATLPNAPLRRQSPGRSKTRHSRPLPGPTQSLRPTPDVRSAERFVHRPGNSGIRNIIRADPTSASVVIDGRAQMLKRNMSSSRRAIALRAENDVATFHDQPQTERAKAHRALTG